MLASDSSAKRKTSRFSPSPARPKTAVAGQGGAGHTTIGSGRPGRAISLLGAVPTHDMGKTVFLFPTAAMRLRQEMPGIEFNHRLDKTIGAAKFLDILATSSSVLFRERIDCRALVNLVAVTGDAVIDEQREIVGKISRGPKL